ncbi:MAG: hypothetical protein IKU23_03255 [Clostridia bacterium]|nr:hypothetical protein [Clostridia bacterium]
MEYFLNSKLNESNKELSKREKYKFENPDKKVTFKGLLSECNFYQKLHDIKMNFKK